ncbi:MAG: hypothetical protein ACLGG9_00065 [Thermoleophilia bacterium]
MRIRPIRPLLAALAASGVLAAAPVGAQDAPLTGIGAHLSCAAPADAAALDNMLARAGSPLAGEGATFVREGRRVGVDPRALVAIAAHETLLATYTPADRIRNAFGLGPGWSFPTHGDAIARAASTLEALYLPEGRIRIPEIGAKWAPVGAENDPTNLNQHWANGVGAYYRALGGDPDSPILLSAQSADGDCAPSTAGGDTPAESPADDPAPTGPPVVTAWGGVTPRVAGVAAADGADPATGAPAVIDGFVFPLALQVGARADYADTFALPGPVECGDGARLRCALSIGSDAGAAVVAMAPGTLQAATVAGREEGVALWIVTGAGDRLAYGPLAEYTPGVAPGAVVAAGQRLGTTPGLLRVAWDRAGTRINPFPLLASTRSPIP